jgi:hypothetical protein
MHISVQKSNLIITLSQIWKPFIRLKGVNLSASSCHSWADYRTKLQQATGAEGANQFHAQAKLLGEEGMERRRKKMLKKHFMPEM